MTFHWIPANLFTKLDYMHETVYPIYIHESTVEQ